MRRYPSRPISSLSHGQLCSKGRTSYFQSSKWCTPAGYGRPTHSPSTTHSMFRTSNGRSAICAAHGSHLSGLQTLVRTLVQTYSAGLWSNSCSSFRTSLHKGVRFANFICARRSYFHSFGCILCSTKFHLRGNRIQYGSFKTRRRRFTPYRRCYPTQHPSTRTSIRVLNATKRLQWVRSNFGNRSYRGSRGYFSRLLRNSVSSRVVKYHCSRGLVYTR